LLHGIIIVSRRIKTGFVKEDGPFYQRQPISGLHVLSVMARAKYEIKNVVAQDEWAENVDNNAFTNAAAKSNLQNAYRSCKILGTCS
jgi:hypothetical protein